MQKTDFPFEIIVSDDCSKDGTVAILNQYASRFPEKIRLILGDRNLGGPNNLRRVIEASASKYITCLDGDDYYTDCYKLQKQVEFLEEHEDYVACFHNVLNIHPDGSRSLFMPLDFPNVHTAYDVISKDWFLPIHSIVMRRHLVSFPEWYDQVMNDDFVVNLSVVMHGPYYYMPDIMVVYRHHDANTSNAYSNQILIDGQLKQILEGFKEIYSDEYGETFDSRISFYSQRISFNEREIHQPWRKWFRLKTYKRKLKNVLRKFLLL